MIGLPEWWPGTVSRETLDKLQAYADLIRKWNPRINLVARSTLSELNNRHIWDSAQVFRPRSGTWVDIGSGGGLPGIVVAILAEDAGIPTQMTLVESDQRKAAFLRTCARELELACSITARRVEDIPALNAHTVSARALASLDRLLHLSSRHLAADGMCIFQKGAQWKDELNASQQNWRFSWTAKPSNTHPEAVVLELKDIQRV